MPCITEAYARRGRGKSGSRITSIRLSDDLLFGLDSRADALGRPLSWLIEQAVVRYLDREAWQAAAVTQTLNECRTGGATSTPHHEGMQQLYGRIRAHLSDAGRSARGSGEPFREAAQLLLHR